jgi:hypothetical protein
MTLARLAKKLPALGRAVQSAVVGSEAAVRIGKVAREDTIDAWVERAAKRTVKHLHEEIEAWKMLRRLGVLTHMGPLSEAMLETAFEIERMVLRGDVIGCDQRECDPDDDPVEEIEDEAAGTVCDLVSAGGCGGTGEEVGLDDGEVVVPERAPRWHSATSLEMKMSVAEPIVVAADAIAAAPQMSVPQPRSEVAAVIDGGCDPRLAMRKWTLKLNLPYREYLRWTGLEAIHAQMGSAESFVESMLQAVWEVWGHAVGLERAYEHIYVRDRHRCTNPTCRKRTLNPHHLKFRAHGGGEEDENLATLCPDCHLFGVHEAKIVVDPPASNMRWVLGRNATLVVQGREKVWAAPAGPIPVVAA